jgi:hypothetical protein
MGESTVAYKVLVRRFDGKTYLEELIGNGIMILKWILSKWDGDAFISIVTETGGRLL